MLTIDMLCAILQGLTTNYIEHLGDPWTSIGFRAQRALKEGADPLTALKMAFENMAYWEQYAFQRFVSTVLPVMQLPGLTYRQREALIALRFKKVASLAQLTHILGQDRRLIHRRLAALVDKGLVFRFFQPGGVYYFAPSTAMDKELKRSVNHFVKDLIENFKSSDPSLMTPMTPMTSMTPPTLMTPPMGFD